MDVAWSGSYRGTPVSDGRMLVSRCTVSPGLIQDRHENIEMASIRSRDDVLRVCNVARQRLCGINKFNARSGQIDFASRGVISPTQVEESAHCLRSIRFLKEHPI